MNQQNLTQLIEDLKKLPDEQFDMSVPYVRDDVLPCGCIGAWVKKWYFDNKGSSLSALKIYLETDFAEWIYGGDFSSREIYEITKQEAIEYLKTLQEN